MAAAARAVEEVALSRDEELTRLALTRHDSQPPEWRSAETHNTYGLRLTAAELEELVGEIDRLVRPYIGLTRQAVPDGAEVAFLRLNAFRYPDGAPSAR